MVWYCSWSWLPKVGDEAIIETGRGQQRIDTEIKSLKYRKEVVSVVVDPNNELTNEQTYANMVSQRLTNGVCRSSLLGAASVGVNQRPGREAMTPRTFVIRDQQKRWFITQLTRKICFSWEILTHQCESLTRFARSLNRMSMVVPYTGRWVRVLYTYEYLPK